MTDIVTDVITSSKPKRDKDPNALKIASFRTKEGVWAEFCSKAQSIGWTATDVIKAAMEQFISGEYQPTDGVPAQHHDNVLTRDDVLEIVNTVINTLSIQTDENIHTIVITHINTAIDRLTEVVADTRSELVGIREELKKLEGRSAVTNDATAKPSQTTTDTTTTPSPTKTYLSWSEFCELIGEDMPPKGEKKDKAVGQKMIELGSAKGIIGWKYNSNKNRFEVANDN